MNPLLFIAIVAFAVFIVMKFVINPAIARKDAKKAQDAVDRNVEWQLMEGCDHVRDITIDLLARHSEKERIARVMAARIREYLYMGAHPQKIVRLFENLGLYDGPKIAETKKNELSALIKHYALQDIEVHELRCYQSIIFEDQRSGLQKLNKSFLTKAGDSMLIWNLLN
jgi:hypothetical protein